MTGARSLVVGAEGFVGGHLCRHLRQCGDDVVGTCLSEELGDGTQIPLDITDAAAVVEVVTELEPRVIYHLAAISFVPESLRNPSKTFEVNTLGTVHLLAAAARLAQPPRLVFVSTGEVYGLVEPDQTPVSERRPVDPRTPYAASKLAAELALKGCEGIEGAPPWVVLRAFNHTGPGQAPSFVCSDFAAQIAAIEAGRREAVIRVGNLSAQRDFTDVRDVVQAYRLVSERGQPGATYNVASQRPVSIQSILERLLELSATQIRVERDPARLRPVDMPLVVGDASALAAATGWQPRIPLDQTLVDLLEYWRRVEAGDEERAGI